LILFRRNFHVPSKQPPKANAAIESTKSFKINRLSLIVIGGFTIATVFHIIMSSYFKVGYPYNTFLFIPSERFGDFANSINALKDLNPYLRDLRNSTSIGADICNYFPLAVVMEYPFTLIPLRYSFMVFMSAFIIFFAFYADKHIYNTGWRLITRKQPCHFIGQTESVSTRYLHTIILTFFAYPFLFALDRANFEVFLFFFLALFIIFFKQEKFLVSSLLLAIPIGMKLFPAVFLVLFANKKGFKYILSTVFFVLIFNMFSLLLFPGAMLANLKGMMFMQNIYMKMYVIGNDGLAYGHSLFGVMKTIMYTLGYSHDAMFAGKTILNAYLMVAFLVFTLLAAYIFFIETTLWKKIVLLVFSMNLFPYVSADYKLMYLFIPLFQFIQDEEVGRYDSAYLVLFGLLLIPKQYYFFHDNISISIILTPLLMIMMSIVIIREGLMQKKQMNIRSRHSCA
jgi:hypothetical protein